MVRRIHTDVVCRGGLPSLALLPPLPGIGVVYWGVPSLFCGIDLGCGCCGSPIASRGSFDWGGTLALISNSRDVFCFAVSILAYSFFLLSQDVCSPLQSGISVPYLEDKIINLRKVLHYWRQPIGQQRVNPLTNNAKCQPTHKVRLWIDYQRSTLASNCGQ